MSLISTVMVILILSVTLGLSVVNLKPAFERDRTDETFRRIDRLQRAIDEFRAHNGGTMPTNLDDLVTSNGTPCTFSADPANRQLQGWCGPYIDQVFQEDPNSFKIDSWGGSIQLNGLQLISCGANGSCGDDDDIEANL